MIHGPGNLRHAFMFLLILTFEQCIINSILGFPTSVCYFCCLVNHFDYTAIHCSRFVMNALKAKEFFKRDVQYIVRNGKALIINEVIPAATINMLSSDIANAVTSIDG